jgi:hypothetical protein
MRAAAFSRLQFLEKFAAGAGDENPAGNAALAVFHAFHDASGLAAFRTVGALSSVHYFFAICGFGYFGHVFSFNLAAYLRLLIFCSNAAGRAVVSYEVFLF